ncbi:MAG: molybdopterin-dependent oxidoreductase, partial [Thermodesulfobacteriota bacterium]|nr:molybdopterin-dependent oxidoreductase [Thermodesulfobacteriota bacterium]
MEEVKRRDFLKLIGAGAASVSVLGAIPLLHGEFRYLRKRTKNMYAGMVAYDRTVRSTCAGNCTQACGWDAYVKGNMVTGLVQASDYDVYDPAAKGAYNPRGCQRGASFVKYIHGPARIRHPYKRVGKRGEGKFKRISWDDAMKGIAKQTGDIIEKDGADSLVFFSPIPAYNYISAGAGYRLANVLGASGPLSFYDWYCDLPPGDPITWGTQTEESEEWDWTNAEELIFWGSNFAETRMAAAHFVTESKYRGTNLVYIGTDFTATARIADEFISVTPGTDSALTNGVINHIISKKIYDKEYVKLFTDMPFLVKNNDGKFLRENDIVNGGSPFKLYVMDNNSNKPQIAPGCCGDTRESLDLQKFGINPALEGEWSVDLINGEQVKVKTVFSRLKESIKDKTPEWAAKTAGISADTVRNLAERVASKKTTIVGGGGVNHWYNNDVNNRSMIL